LEDFYQDENFFDVPDRVNLPDKEREVLAVPEVEEPACHWFPALEIPTKHQLFKLRQSIIY
jgi:hypothetical protein